MAAAINQARFTINGTPSEDANGNRWYIASFSETLTLALEVNPSPVLSVTYEVFSSVDLGSPYASKDAPELTFNESGSYRYTPDVPNDSATITLPSSGIVTYTIRATVVLAGGGNDVFDREVSIRTTATTPPIRKTVPAETSEFEARGFSDTLNDMVDALQNLASGGGGGGVTLDGAYDFGGDGVGRHIVADAGAVDITVPVAATNNALDITRNSAPSASPMADHYSIFLTGHNDQSIITDKDLYIGRRDAGGGEAYAWFHESASADGGSIWLMAVPDSPDPGREAWLQLSAAAAGGTALLFAGDVAFDDGHRIGSTWSSTGMRFSSTPSNWDDAETLGGGEVSVLELILAAAASGGGTLDDAYDYGGAGLGRTIAADSGSVRVVVPDGAGNIGLEIANSDVTNNTTALLITQNSAGHSILLAGVSEQFIWSDESLVIGAEANIRLTDQYRTASTWSSTGIPLSASSSEWDDIETLIGSEGSLFGAILAAAASGGGGTLDDAYDYGGSGLGRTITADNGSVRFVVPDAANNAALDLDNSDVTNHPNTLQITRNTIPTSAPSDSFSIFLTGSANQSIFSDQVLYVGAVEDSSYSYAYTKYHFDPTNGGALQLYAQGQFSHYAQVDVYASSSLSYIHLTGNNVYLNDTHRNASTWSNSLGIALSSSASEWSAMETLGGGEVSLFALIAAAASGGGGGSLDDAYDYGGSGSGKSITVDAGAVALTVPTSGSTSALALTNLEASNTSELLNIYHDADASTGYAVYIDGTQGAGTSVGEFGHKIWSPGSITIGHSDDDGLATGRRSFLSLQFSEQPTVPGVPSCQAILEASANESGVLDYSSLYARVICESGDYSSIGSHISLETVGSCSIDAGTYGSFTFGGNLTIDATALSLNDTTKLTHVLNATYGSGPASASYASGTVTADFSDNTPCQEVTVTGNVTALSLTAPSGVIPGCTLKLKASSAYTVGGLTNVEWVDGADLSGAAADSIPAGGWMLLSLYYDGATWHGWYGVHS
jgi:hypothetical protein